MTIDQLSKVLKLHKMWQNDEAGGIRANLRHVNLKDADLTGADLTNADLRNANLKNANLNDANLTGADLTDANLSYADLSDANLRYANLCGADLTGAILPDYELCPQTGDFVAYKKVIDDNGESVVLKLLVTGHRNSSLIGRKCRTNKVTVIEAIGAPEGVTKFRSIHDSNFIYEVGKEVTCANYDSDIRVECTAGIHFFTTQKEAKDYVY
jgi:hypothetical protein